MADLPVPPPADPNAPAPNQPAPGDPADPTVPALAAPQIVHSPALNWSHFKPEFSGRPEEDAEAHLLHTNYWMETHNFQEGVKYQRFCLPLVGEARLWYESLWLIANDWQTLQENFR